MQRDEMQCNVNNAMKCYVIRSRMMQCNVMLCNAMQYDAMQ